MIAMYCNFNIDSDLKCTDSVLQKTTTTKTNQYSSKFKKVKTTAIIKN